MWYLVTDGHICLADIVLMTQICAFAPVHKCQSMKTFHSVSGQPPMVQDVILGMISHVFQEDFEGICLGLACEYHFTTVWTPIPIELKEN